MEKLSMKEWIRNKYETHGRQWLHDNFQAFCMETYPPEGKFVHNQETFMRYVREVANGKPLEEPKDIKTVEDQVDFSQVDLTRYNVDKIVTNSWGSDTNQNKQVKVVLSPKENQIDVKELIADFKAEVKDYRPKHTLITREKLTDPVMLEINLPDFHMGLLAWHRETGEDYDVKIATKLYIEAVQAILGMASSYNIEKILLLTGSDFFNSDTIDGTTTKGTRQSEDGRFQKTFHAGWTTLRDAIELCKEVAPVDVVVIPGNHDFSRAYFLGSVLEAWFDKDPDVTIDNEPTYFKFRQYGKCLLGFTHGDTTKPQDLPLLMAHDQPTMWANTKYRAWHTGHIHSMMVFEKPGCTVESVRSLAVASDWIAKMGYRSYREGKGFVWHKERGDIATVNYKP